MCASRDPWHTSHFAFSMIIVSVVSAKVFSRVWEDKVAVCWNDRISCLMLRFVQLQSCVFIYIYIYIIFTHTHTHTKLHISIYTHTHTHTRIKLYHSVYLSVSIVLIMKRCSCTLLTWTSRNNRVSSIPFWQAIHSTSDWVSPVGLILYLRWSLCTLYPHAR